MTLSILRSTAPASDARRCACLCVQEEIEPRTLELLKGYMDELVIGDPRHLSTDVGPVIDDPSRVTLDAHVERMAKEQRIVHRCALPAETSSGTYFAPTLVEIDDISALNARNSVRCCTCSNSRAVTSTRWSRP